MCKYTSCYLVSVTLCLGMVLPSCTEEPAIDYRKLEGRWELVKGFRNQIQTENLTGTYFVFETSGKMKTNLPVGPETFVDYALEEKNILQKHNPEVKYQVIELLDTALVLRLELRGAQFEMHFVRATESAPPMFNAPSSESVSDSIPLNSPEH